MLINILCLRGIQAKGTDGFHTWHFHVKKLQKVPSNDEKNIFFLEIDQYMKI